MNEIEKSLLPLTTAELEHKFHPERQALLYQSFPSVRKFNGQPVYLFSFSPLASERKFIQLGNSLSKDITLMVNQHSRYSQVPLHIHDYVEINCVLSGHVDELIEGKTYHLDAGDLCLINTHTIHTLGQTTENDIIVNLLIKKVYFTSSFLGKIPSSGELATFLMHCIATQYDDSGFLIVKHAITIKDLLLDLIQEQKQAAPGFESVMEAMLLIFFITLTRENDYIISTPPDLTTEIQNYIQANFRTTSLIDAADHFNFQPNYFSTLVKKRTGKTFKQLLISCQMNMAAHFLISTDWPISQIIIEVGSSNPTFFYRKFSEETGYTPNTYRAHFTKR